MSLLSIFGCGRAKTPEYPADRLSARDGTEFTITFFKHASLAISVGGKYIYVDPVSANADYGALPKADVVLITHSHYDHLDVGGRREAARRRHRNPLRPDLGRSFRNELLHDASGQRRHAARLCEGRGRRGL